MEPLTDLSRTSAKALLAMRNVSKPTDWKLERIKQLTGMNPPPMPEYFAEEGSADIGCWRSPTSGTTCPAGFHYDNHKEACRSDSGTENALKASCTAAGGEVFVEINVNWIYMPMNKATCDNGRCQGSLQETSWFASWTPAQCELYSKKSCSRSCKVCSATGKFGDGVSGTYPTGGEHVPANELFHHGEDGACFTSANVLKTEWQFRSRDSCVGNQECDSGNCQFYSCRELTWNQTACTQTLPTAIQNVLQCSLGGPIEASWGSYETWDTCPTEELCETSGECEGAWEYATSQKCNDAGWRYGERCWGEYMEIREEDQVMGATTVRVNRTEWRHASCSSCENTDEGACVASSGPKGCVPSGRAR